MTFKYTRDEMETIQLQQDRARARTAHFNDGVSGAHWDAGERDAERGVSDRSLGEGGYAEMLGGMRGAHRSAAAVDSPSQAHSRYQYGARDWRKRATPRLPGISSI